MKYMWHQHSEADHWVRLVCVLQSTNFVIWIRIIGNLSHTVCKWPCETYRWQPLAWCSDIPHDQTQKSHFGKHHLIFVYNLAEKSKGGSWWDIVLRKIQITGIINDGRILSSAWRLLYEIWNLGYNVIITVTASAKIGDLMEDTGLPVPTVFVHDHTTWQLILTTLKASAGNQHQQLSNKSSRQSHNCSKFICFWMNLKSWLWYL